MITYGFEYGDQGAYVEKIQKMLQGWGSKIKINGSYTIGTKTAVMNFQRKNKLPVTGIVDKQTWDVLVKQNNKWHTFIRKFKDWWNYVPTKIK